MALDGSSIYHRIPAPVPCTEAGLISVAIVRIDVERLESLPQLPESRATDPVQLRETEDASTLQLALPGRNARSVEGQASREWFRTEVQATLENGHYGGENLAATLHALLEEPRAISAPTCNADRDPSRRRSETMSSACDSCGGEVLLGDALRAQDIFSDEQALRRRTRRIRHGSRILSLMNLLRELVKIEHGRRALRRIAFVLDGPLAAFSTIAVLQAGVLVSSAGLTHCCRRALLVMSGVKTGAFVQHFNRTAKLPHPTRAFPRERLGFRMIATSARTSSLGPQISRGA